ncbi:hypothetical protein N3K66_000540 [Trichothecium roseum]|uniref:Uncharacterized protein n=1 Tax=Trichothecium roseum TaxID=47278 RepID=A0ACC0VDP9_9HYPO|nr:hypothetical protein N3K66_000540 [Trichothecium roseum]
MLSTTSVPLGSCVDHRLQVPASGLSASVACYPLIAVKAITALRTITVRIQATMAMEEVIVPPLALPRLSKVMAAKADTGAITHLLPALPLLSRAMASLAVMVDTEAFGHGAPDGYTFQYSDCSGRRKALLIGINYFGQDGELRGCINDVHNVSAFLAENHGYKREDMVLLTDDQSNPVMQPTRENIIRAMGWLVRDAQANDALFLHYSGHGGQTEDLDGDEDDGYDEVIYPVDFQKAGHIVDDEIHFRVVKPLQQGVRLTAIFDSCHSATVMDLPYVYSTKGVLKEPNLAKEAGEGLLGAFSAYASGDMGGVAKSIFGFAKSAYKGDDAYEKTKDTRTSPADVIMWSGSKDDQTSADATIASKATGAMSWAFISALKANPKQSYVELLNSIRDILETKYSQKPQLSSSHPLDTNILFVM